MRILRNITPNKEQMTLGQSGKSGVVLIRGAAGSGKTSTALLRLKLLTGVYEIQRERQDRTDPVKILVLTYNTTLKGYIEELVREHAKDAKKSEIDILTFGKWSRDRLGITQRIVEESAQNKIIELGGNIELPERFLCDEVEYALGRFLPEDIHDYITAGRTGRGNSPRMDGGKREQLIEEVLIPYGQWKSENGDFDWNDLAVQAATKSFDEKYDIIIADEAQDFSANQIRAINNALAEEHSLTFVLDTAQRIYARGFTWKEAGILVQPENSYKLSENFRNTKQIARLAAPLVEGLAIGDDGSLPNFDTCQREGEVPNILVGYFNQQVSCVIDYIKNNVDLKNETVGMLNMGGSPKYIKEAFIKSGLEYVSITRNSEWPDGDENIAFSTLHSAKGLEFDHVFILGLSEEFNSHGDDEDDDRLITLRRLLAMGIGRARETVTLGYKPGEESILLKYLVNGTYQEVVL